MTISSEVLRAVEPRQAAAWMRANGWSLVDTRPEHTARYQKPAGAEGEFEVTLPLDPAFRDYTRRVREVIETLAVASGRPSAWVLAELRASTFDIVRLRATGPGIGPGRVPVETGTRLFAQTRELLLAAACAAHEPRPVYRTRRPTEATDFLRRVKLAAPEEGSFIVTIYAPVPPGLGFDDAEGQEVPFERRATTMLATASAAARRAAESAGLGGGAQPFLDGAALGVSANLCEALAGLVDGEETSRIDLMFAWASSRPAPAGAPTSVHVGSDLASLLQEGARLLRATATTPDYPLEGIVVRLESDNPEAGGVAVVTGQIDGQARKVQVAMNREDYSLAIGAHERQDFLRCEGELRRQGGRFILERVRHVEVVGEG